jgi:hypothetical protein
VEDNNNAEVSANTVEPAEEEDDTAYHTATEVEEGEGGGGWGGAIQNVDGSNDVTDESIINNNAGEEAESNLESGLWGTVDQSDAAVVNAACDDGGEEAVGDETTGGEWGTVNQGDASAGCSSTSVWKNAFYHNS